MKNSQIYKWLILIMMVLSGCETLATSSSHDFPDIDLPLNKMNKAMKLTTSREFNTFKIGDDIAMELVNLTNYPINLADDLGVMIYTKQNNHWTSLENCMGYPTGEFVLYPKEQIAHGWFTVHVYPCHFQDDTKSNKIRVFVFGEQKDPDTSTSKKVGAYIDLWLSP